MIDLEYVTYEKRMKKLGLFSLERGLRGEQVLSSIIIHGPGLYFPSTHSKRSRSYSHKVQEGKFQLDVRKKTFTARVVGLWNRLPRERWKRL